MATLQPPHQQRVPLRPTVQQCSDRLRAVDVGCRVDLPPPPATAAASPARPTITCHRHVIAGAQHPHILPNHFVIAKAWPPVLLSLKQEILQRPDDWRHKQRFACDGVVVDGRPAAVELGEESVSRPFLAVATEGLAALLLQVAEEALEPVVVLTASMLQGEWLPRLGESVRAAEKRMGGPMAPAARARALHRGSGASVAA